MEDERKTGVKVDGDCFIVVLYSELGQWARVECLVIGANLFTKDLRRESVPQGENS